MPVGKAKAFQRWWKFWAKTRGQATAEEIPLLSETAETSNGSVALIADQLIDSVPMGNSAFIAELAPGKKNSDLMIGLSGRGKRDRDARELQIIHVAGAST